VLAIAAVGGIRPGLVASVGASMLTNWYLTPPVHTWTIGDTDNFVALGVFITVAIGVSLLVDRTARQSREARRARADATALARSTGSIIAAADPLPDLVDQVRTLFGLDSVAVLDRVGSEWVINTSAGADPPTSPDDGTSIRLDDAGAVQLVLRGAAITGDDLDVLRAFGDQVALALEARQLRRDAESIESLTEANALRTALLQAVSHDLRTPLASIKASASSLRQTDIEWSDQDRAEFLETIEEETDRLTALVSNLLDMSRLQAGVLQPSLRSVNLEEVVPAAIASLGERAYGVIYDVPETLDPVRADAALLERVVANLVENAMRFSPGDQPARITAGRVHDRVDLRVIDHGPGIAADSRERVFQPFQRLGDRGGSGVGLGLAVARGFVRAMEGELLIEDTPDGGTTAIVSLGVAL